jgi:hypothetical protein
MMFAKGILCLLGMFCVVPAWSQERSEAERFYDADEHALIRDFEREHIPLDGSKVQYIPFRKSEKFGFADKRTHAMKIAPVYEQVFATYPEGAIVSPDGDRYGLVNYEGKFLIPPAFRNLYKEGDLYHGLFSGRDTTRQSPYDSYIGNYYFNEKGELLFYAHAHRFESFSAIDSLAWFRYGRTYSVYNRAGKMVKTFEYDSVKTFQGIFGNSLVFMTPGNDGTNTFSAYTVDGRLLYSLPLEENYVRELYQLNQHMYGLVTGDGFLFVNEKGEPYDFGLVFGAIGFGFENEFDGYYNTGPLLVRSDDDKRCGYLSRDGRFLLPLEYSYLGVPGDNGWIAFSKPDAYGVGFIDTTGKVRMPATINPFGLRQMDAFGLNLQFHEGLCVTAGQRSDTLYGDSDPKNYRWYYINEQGQTVFELPDSTVMAGHFSGGLAPVMFASGGLGFIDKKGKLRIAPKYAPAMAGAYPLPQIVLPYFRNGYAYLKGWKGYVDSTGYEFFGGKRVYDHYDFSH